MGTKAVVAATFIILFSLGLAFQQFPVSAILICAVSIALGSALPDIDRLLYPFWPALRILIMLMAAFLFAYSIALGPAICYFFHVPFCSFLLPTAVLLLLAFLFLFGFLDPAAPPFHNLVAMAFCSLLYAVALSRIGFIEFSFLATGAFAAAYCLHYFLEISDVDRNA
ncbi:MAG: hypothetical protein QXH30_03195 [Candidatus Bilamarchaeaceae archaeon]